MSGEITRRDFLKKSATAAGGLSAATILTPRFARGEEMVIKKYRKLGDTGFKVSDIGFGAGPLKDPAILKNGLEKGINYIDTAQSYGKGASEEAVGKVMKNFKAREKIFITTKFSDAAIFEPENLKKNLMAALDLSLKRMKTEYIDSLLIHAIDTGRGNAAELKQAAADNPQLYEFVDEAKKAGKLRFFGLSSHSNHEMLKYILKYPKYYKLILYPYGWAAKPGESRNMLEKCDKNGVGLTLMKTRTGCLELNIRGIEKVKVDKENPYRSKFTKEYLENAIVYVNNQPLVDTVLVGIKTFEDLEWALSLSNKKY